MLKKFNSRYMKNIYVTNSPLQFIFALSIQKLLSNNKNYLILWFGNVSLKESFPESIDLSLFNTLDLSDIKLNYLKEFIRNRKILEKILKDNVDEINLLFTMYETHFAFEIIKNLYKIPWSKIGIIDDGMGNYIPHSMPKLYRQIPKYIILKVLTGISLTLSRFNSGGNKRISFISTVNPENIYLHKKSRAKVLDIRETFAEILASINAHDNELKSAEVIIFLPPFLHYKRLNQDQLNIYIDKIINHPKISKYKKILFKPHPKENIQILQDIISKRDEKNLKLFTSKYPIEIYLHLIQANVIAGNVSTAILNHYFYYKNSDSLYLITYGQGGGLYVKDQIEVFKKIIGNKMEILKTN